MVPVGRSLLKYAEMADHFSAFRHVVSHMEAPFDEVLLRETNRLVITNCKSFDLPQILFVYFNLRASTLLRLFRESSGFRAVC